MLAIPEPADFVELFTLTARYARALDTRDYELFVSCFVPDAVITYANPNMRTGTIAYDGPQEAADGLKQIHAPMDATMHRMSNQYFQADGDRATGRVYVDVFEVRRDAGADASVLNHVGYYDDDYVRTPDGWRIAKRAYTGVWSGGNKKLGDYAAVSTD